ncbi:MAG: aminotransferase class III-fold pyridoxal phosphate-dependent enzyme [Gammaproteobacteria bacterium]|nr:aminotransferase class III-fold pyridoxal phosphate-dependent enzyme [Gammaproteobacteria bacterium]
MHAKDMEARHLLQVYGQLAIEPDAGDGVYLLDGDRRILDLYGGHAVAALGYGHPELLDVLQSQAGRLFFQSNAVAMQVRARAADALAEFAPRNLERVFFVNSGAEANENALRLACRLTGRQHIAAIEHGFHGRTAAAGAATWGASRWYGFPRKPFDVDFIPRDNVAAVGDLVSGDTAAVIVELVQGVAGAVDLDTDFVQAIAAACEAHGALLIVDEVQSGIGRCGQAFAADIYGVQPDMITAAKSLGAGFPCGAVLTTADVASATGKGDLGTTFGGGPLACALIEKVIEVIRRDDLMKNVRELHARLAAALPLGPVERLQGIGFLAGLRCTRPAAEVQRELLEQDILTGSSADPAVIRLLPPLTLGTEHIDQLLEILAALPAN